MWGGRQSTDCPSFANHGLVAKRSIHMKSDEEGGPRATKTRKVGFHTLATDIDDPG